MTLQFDEYKQKIKTILQNHGVDERQSASVADYMATVDFYGISSHGAFSLPGHLQRIENGAYNLAPNFRVERESAAFAVINGDNSIGMVSAGFCVDYAMEKAKASGIYTVYSHNNNTYGAAFYYALQAAQKGFICFTMSNSPAQMAPIGGKEKLLGTNPFAVAIPALSESPIIVDMATSVLAKSKIKELQEKGATLPEGVALDADGNPTTDPGKALGGIMLPMAGFKGYGIAMVIDVLAGVLPGAAYLNHVGRFYSEKQASMNVGFSFTVISPEIVFGDDFYQKMDAYIQTVRASKPLDGKTVAIPGDDRLFKYRENMKNGLEWNLS